MVGAVTLADPVPRAKAGERSIPVSAKPLLRLKSARSKTRVPEKRRKRREKDPLAVDDMALILRSEGRVPRAKVNIVSAPVTKLPEARATNWRDCVKPQGRKKGPAPRRRGAAGFLLSERLAIPCARYFGGRMGQLPLGMIWRMVSAR